jgi:hypothetical protein
MVDGVLVAPLEDALDVLAPHIQDAEGAAQDVLRVSANGWAPSATQCETRNAALKEPIEVPVTMSGTRGRCSVIQVAPVQSALSTPTS